MQNPEILIIGAAIIDVLARPVNTRYSIQVPTLSKIFI